MSYLVSVAIVMSLMLLTGCGGGKSSVPGTVLSDEENVETTSISGKSGYERAVKRNKVDVVVAEGIYKNGAKHGSWVTFHPSNGLVKTVTTYEDGVKQGAYLKMNERGQFEEKAFYVNDKLDGQHIVFNRTRVKEESFYQAGNLEGARKIYYDDGSLQEESHFKNGKRHGSARWFNQMGEITISYEYKNGEKVN